MSLLIFKGKLSCLGALFNADKPRYFRFRNAKVTSSIPVSGTIRNKQKGQFLGIGLFLLSDPSWNRLTLFCRSKEVSMESKCKRTWCNCGPAFKLSVVGQVEQGKLTYKEAQRRYGFKGARQDSQFRQQMPLSLK